MVTCSISYVGDHGIHSWCDIVRSKHSSNILYVTHSACQFFFFFYNCSRDLGSIPGRIIPKILKMVLDTSLLNAQQLRYVLRVKWSNPGKGVASFPTPQCCSYRKGSLRVSLSYGVQLTYYLKIKKKTYVKTTLPGARRTIAFIFINPAFFWSWSIIYDNQKRIYYYWVE